MLWIAACFLGVVLSLDILKADGKPRITQRHSIFRPLAAKYRVYDYLELVSSVDLRPRQLRTECGLLDILEKAL